MKSDFTSFIEANIYMQTGEYSGVRVICDLTARHNRTLAWRVGHEPANVHFLII